jgi:hypothetical protein
MDPAAWEQDARRRNALQAPERRPARIVEPGPPPAVLTSPERVG